MFLLVRILFVAFFLWILWQAMSFVKSSFSSLLIGSMTGMVWLFSLLIWVTGFTGAVKLVTWVVSLLRGDAMLPGRSIFFKHLGGEVVLYNVDADIPQLLLRSFIPKKLKIKFRSKQCGFSYCNAWSTQQQNVGMGGMWVGHYGCCLCLWYKRLLDTHRTV